MILLKRYSNNILSLLKRESINVPVGISLLLVILLIFPFAHDVIYNEIFLASFEKQTRQYSHPPDSKLTQRISIIGNFAPASNQCGFIVAEARTSKLQPNNIRSFYSPILNTPSYNDPPYHEISLFILKDKKDIQSIEQFYPDLYEQIIPGAMNDTNAYLLVTAETGYPPNNDLRCH